MLLLTTDELPTMVLVMATTTSRSHQSGHRPFEVRLRPCLCLVVALLVLYNPFLAVASSSGTLSINHTPSYRATIASSELQHFSPTDGRKTFSVPVTILFDWFALFVIVLAGRALQVSTQHVHTCQHFYADLWFRPPPQFTSIFSIS
jgi:hypothetical protein